MYYYYRLILVYHSSCTLSILDQNVPFCNYSSFIMNTWCTDTLLPMWVFKIQSKIIHDPSETLAILFPDTSPSNENIGCVFSPSWPIENWLQVIADPGQGTFSHWVTKAGPALRTNLQYTYWNQVKSLSMPPFCHSPYCVYILSWCLNWVSSIDYLGPGQHSGNLSSKLSEFYTGRKQYSWHDNMMSAWLAFRFGGAVYSYPWFLCYISDWEKCKRSLRRILFQFVI